MKKKMGKERENFINRFNFKRDRRTYKSLICLALVEHQLLAVVHHPVESILYSLQNISVMLHRLDLYRLIVHQRQTTRKKKTIGIYFK